MVSNKNLLADFEQLSTARNIQAEAIRNYLSDNGVEKPAHEGGLGGTLHRAWLDIKGTLSNRSDSVSISSCLSGDQAAVTAYQEVLDEQDLPVDLQKLLTEHLEDLKGDVENLEKLAKES
ncbi:MAG: DUF2383 domain-containing protein [Sphingobacteriaceae bacterium]|nr:MAG: DUF2383 domain-containing protein [Sphingobacteriaceae bacterium]